MSDNLGRQATRKITTFGHVAPCRMGEYRRFGRTCCLHHLGGKVSVLLKMEATIFSEILKIHVRLYCVRSLRLLQTIFMHILGIRLFHIHIRFFFYIVTLFLYWTSVAEIRDTFCNVEKLSNVIMNLWIYYFIFVSSIVFTIKYFKMRLLVGWAVFLKTDFGFTYPYGRMCSTWNQFHTSSSCVGPDASI